MKAKNPQGEIVEVTKKAYSTLYRYRGWTLVKDDEGKAIESVPKAETILEEVDLSKLKKVELQELVSEKGIEFKADDTKEDLINLLNA
nr:MAG TPA: dimeris T4 recombination endonuclease VII [Caudoviricetes sp.]